VETPRFARGDNKRGARGGNKREAQGDNKRGARGGKKEARGDGKRGDSEALLYHTISSYKSFHSGLNFSIISIFFFPLQLFICFSL